MLLLSKVYVMLTSMSKIKIKNGRNYKTNGGGNRKKNLKLMTKSNWKKKTFAFKNSIDTKFIIRQEKEFKKIYFKDYVKYFSTLKFSKIKCEHLLSSQQTWIPFQRPILNY